MNRWWHWWNIYKLGWTNRIYNSSLVTWNLFFFRQVVESKNRRWWKRSRIMLGPHRDRWWCLRLDIGTLPGRKMCDIFFLKPPRVFWGTPFERRNNGVNRMCVAIVMTWMTRLSRLAAGTFWWVLSFAANLLEISSWSFKLNKISIGFVLFLGLYFFCWIWFLFGWGW